MGRVSRVTGTASAQFSRARGCNLFFLMTHHRITHRILGIPWRRLGYSATTDAVVSVLTFICFGVTLSTGTIYYT